MTLIILKTLIYCLRYLVTVMRRDSAAAGAMGASPQNGAKKRLIYVLRRAASAPANLSPLARASVKSKSNLQRRGLFISSARIFSALTVRISGTLDLSALSPRVRASTAPVA